MASNQPIQRNGQKGICDLVFFPRIRFDKSIIIQKMLHIIYAKEKLIIPWRVPSVSPINRAIRKSPHPTQVGISTSSSCLFFLKKSIIKANGKVKYQ